MPIADVPMNDPDAKPRRPSYHPRAADDAAPEDSRPLPVQPGPKGLWTIPEVCIWATTRHHAAVDALSSDYGQKGADYELEGAHHLDATLFLSDAYGAHVALWFAINQAELPTRLDVCEALPGLFERAALTVFGLLYDKGAPAQIPPSAWNLGCTLKYSELRGSWCAYPADDSGRWWSKLRVPSAEVMRVWAPGAAPPLASPAERAAEAPKAEPKKPDLECMREWYRLERVEKHDAQKPPPSREDDQKAARKYFKMGGLNPLVREARAAEAPWNWKQGGSRGRKAAELRTRQKAQRDRLTR
jgi:hypothetical protein